MAQITAFRSFILVAAVLAASSIALADWNEGLSAFNAGEFQAAAEHFTETTRSNPKWPGGYYMLGRCLVAQEQGKEAIQNFQKAVDLDPSYSDAIIALSRALMVEKEFGKTRKLLENTDTAAMPPAQRSQTSILLATAMFGEGNAQAAVALLKERLSEDDKNPALYQTLGKAQTAAGDRESAFGSFSKAFELHPEESSALAATNAALALADAAPNADQKKQWFQKALEAATILATSFPDLKYDHLAGQAALGAEDLDSAEIWFRAAVSKDQNDPQAWYFLGRTLAKLGRDKEAYDAFSKALTARPDEVLTRRIHGRMGQIAACRFELEAAAAHYHSAHQEDRAKQIEDLVAQYAEALTHREKLQATVQELQGMEGELEELGDSQGVAVVGERVVAERAEIREIESNLEAVRSALCQ